jgi:DNA-binding transcriptional ArsR family regulator
MSEPLNDEQRIKMWKEIQQSIVDASNPREGEMTLTDIIEQIGTMTKGQVRTKISRLLEAGILSVRKITTDGGTLNVYFPEKELSQEELLDILTER